MGDLARQADVFDGVFPIAPEDRRDAAFHVAAFAASSDEAMDLAGMLGLDTEYMQDFAAADAAWMEHRAGYCEHGHRGWPCAK